MTATDQELASRFEWYVEHIITLAPPPPGARDFRLPTGPRPLPYNRVYTALVSPAILFGGAEPATTVRHRMDRLAVFALWLGAAPHDLPVGLASRAARFRFLLWSLPARVVPELRPQLLSPSVSWASAGRSETELDAELIRAQARTAREDWIGFLQVAEDDPWLAGLAAAGDRRIERDLPWITGAWPRTRPDQPRLGPG